MRRIIITIIVICIALVIIISNFSHKDEPGTNAPTQTFDILGYYNKYKDYYGDVPLEDVAKDAYNKGYHHGEPDYNSWVKSAGIEPLIQADNERRKPKPPSFLDKVMGAIPFRYDEESIQGYQYRYDRFTRTMQVRQGSDENTFKWVPMPPYFKNPQHVRDFMAKREKDRQILAIEKQNEKLNRNVEELKDSIDSMKREQKFKEMNRKD